MNNVIVGLGCSWTQGEGGYPEEIWKQYNGKINLPMHKGMHLIPIELEHSWVNVLAKQKDYYPINLGQRGIGNRAAARTLYLTNTDWSKVENGIVVFMLSGFERFDFFRDGWADTGICGTSKVKDVGHYNFQTLWPHLGHNDQMTAYAKYLYSESGTAAEQMCNILEVQTFCKAHNLKFVIANAFDGRGKSFFFDHCSDLANKIDWDCYIHDSTDYESFVELLVKKDKFVPLNEWRNYYGYYQGSEWPKQYLSNCIHPTIEGYKVIADELSKFIKQRYNI
jgi:hypothetical protein